MSSSYSSLDWVLSYWANFTVPRLICVYFVCFCFILHSCIIVSVVEWTWWDWSLILRTYLPSVLLHCWLGHLTCKNLSPVWPIMCLVGLNRLNRSVILAVEYCVCDSYFGALHLWGCYAHGIPSVLTPVVLVLGTMFLMLSSWQRNCDLREFSWFI